MFDLVDRVEDYPQFLPWCSKTELIERNDRHTAARLHIRFKGIQTHFSTENTKIVPQRMDIRLREGPFRQLHGSWVFASLGEHACKITFELHYEFSSTLLEKVLGPVFNHIVGTFVDSFVQRADTRYGHPEY